MIRIEWSAGHPEDPSLPCRGDGLETPPVLVPVTGVETPERTTKSRAGLSWSALSHLVVTLRRLALYGSESVSNGIQSFSGGTTLGKISRSFPRSEGVYRPALC
jgi:hypothetical protein